jgi:molybdate transport system substrate-binding protein
MPRPEVIVFAASSTVTALDGLAAQFEKGHGARMTVSYGSSSALAQQILNGAPADVYISADPAWAATLEERGRVVRRVDFLGNSLVLVAPVTAADAVKRPEDLTSDAVKYVAIGDPASVPAGKYAKEALETLGLWRRVEAKAVPAMDARHALLYVERGEADAGIVYATDAKNSRAVRVVAALDGSLKTPVRYTLVLVKRDVPSAKAEDCFAFLLSDASMRGFEAAGFTRLPGPAKPAAPGK